MTAVNQKKREKKKKKCAWRTEGIENVNGKTNGHDKNKEK